MFKLVLEKAGEPEIKLPTSAGSSKKKENSRKTSISALLTMPKPLTVDHNKLWKILKEIRIPDHLSCLLRNLYAGQEAGVRTGHGTTDWFQIGKGVLYSSTMLLIHSICERLHLLTPTSHSVRHLVLSPLALTNLFLMTELLLLFHG